MTSPSAHGPAAAAPSSSPSSPSSPPPAPSSAASVGRNLLPLVVDVAVPLGVYAVFHLVLGVGVVGALVASSVVPVVRTLSSLVGGGSLNGLAALMLACNVAGMALSGVVGDPRLLVAKDSGVSLVLAGGILISVWRGRPIMSAALMPYVTRGHAARTAAWEALWTTSARFVRLQRRFTMIWGVALCADCVARIVAAFLVPLPALAWISAPSVIVTVLAAMVVGGGAAAEPLGTLVDAEVAASSGVRSD